jgi:heterodisulfide reductase subunit B
MIDDVSAWDHVDVSESCGCLVCGTPTRSHSLSIALDDVSDHIVPVETKTDADSVVAVCHDCFTEVDGSATRAVLTTRSTDDVETPETG